MKQIHVLFSGAVQGVGFRYTTERIARHFEVTGYVKNLPNGKVETVAEGEEQALKDFLQALCDSDMKSYIRDVHTEWSEATGKFQGFGVAY